MFGHCRGAFTDARTDQPGLVQLAEDGTLFLDAIDSLTPRAQVALLRFLEERRFRPLGSSQTRAANVRVVAACNRPLEELCDRGKFRRDLYYRIKIVEAFLPPLRARPGDPVQLAEYFLMRCAARYLDGPRKLHPETLAWIDRHQWSGNVRELENLIDSHYLLCDGDELQIAHVSARGAPATATAKESSTPHEILSYRLAKADAIARFDRDYLARVMLEVPPRDRVRPLYRTMSDGCIPHRPIAGRNPILLSRSSDRAGRHASGDTALVFVGGSDRLISSGEFSCARIEAHPSVS